MFVFGNGSSAIDPGDNVAKSIRHRASAGPYLSRTFGAPTNLTIYTYSTWKKRGNLGTTQDLLSAAVTTNFGFNSSNNLRLELNGTTYTTTQVFRDPTAWLHVVYSQNGTTYTVSVNGVVVMTGTSVANTEFNNSVAHRLGVSTTGVNYFDGVSSDDIFVDGTALGASSFGRTSSATGQWVHKNPTGITYGNNGVRLQYATVSVAADFGTDTSGNGNTWTVTNFSATAGVTNDSVIDTPTNNFCTLNPLNYYKPDATVERANLYYNAGASGGSGGGTIGFDIATSKFEWQVTIASGAFLGIGVVPASDNLIDTGGATPNMRWIYGSNGNKYIGNAATAYGAGFTTGDVIKVRIDNGAVEFFKNGTSHGVAWSGLSGLWVPTVYHASPATATYDFGQLGFAPAAGYLTLCTANLPATSVVEVSGTFTGNALADGPCSFLNGYPDTLTINGNAVTFGTHADKLASGFKLRTASSSYNAAGANTWTATITSNVRNNFKYANAQVN